MVENGRSGEAQRTSIFAASGPKADGWQSARDCRCPSLQVDDPAPRGMRDRVRASGCVQLVDHTADMEFGCIRRDAKPATDLLIGQRSDEHTSELHSLMRILYAVFC